MVCGRTPAVLFIARDDKGEYVRVLEYSNHPGLRPPLQWRGTGYVPLRSNFPLYGGVARSAGVVYSMAQACSNTYEPALSLYVVFAGAYIMHDPLGLDTIQLVAVPADV